MRSVSRKNFCLLTLTALIWLGGLPLRGAPVLVYSTYFGDEGWDTGLAVAWDTTGNAYFTGFTEAIDSSPTGGPLFSVDAYVLKVAPSGRLIWSVRLAGAEWDEASALAVDAAGNVWVAGSTGSPDFPRVHPLEPSPASPAGTFLAKLNPAGDLVFSTFYGGSGFQSVAGLALDAAGNIYVGGATTSRDFPTTAGAAQRSYAEGKSNAYVMKLDPAAPRVVWSTYVAAPGDGQSWFEQASGFAVDAAGHAYVSWRGYTARLHPAGAALDYVVPVGGHKVAADAEGNAYLLGSQDSGRPYSDADVRVTRLGPTGVPTGSVVLGGTWDDWGEGIAISPQGHVYVVGETQSADFPIRNAVQPQCSGGEEINSCWNIGFLTEMRGDTWDIVQSTYIGGGRSVVNQRDRTVALGVAGDARGNTWATGWTAEEDFEVFNAFQPAFAGGEDAFLLRIASNRPPDCSAAAASPSLLWPANDRMVPVSITGITDPDGGPVSIVVTAVRQDEPLTRPGSADGAGSPAAQVRASRAGAGDGRVYHLAFEARDPQGGSCTGTVRVCVPHDRRPGTTCGDGGALYDSIR